MAPWPARWSCRNRLGKSQARIGDGGAASPVAIDEEGAPSAALATKLQGLQGCCKSASLLRPEPASLEVMGSCSATPARPKDVAKAKGIVNHHKAAEEVALVRAPGLAAIADCQ